MVVDLLNLEPSGVQGGLKGLKILLYGASSIGKTKNAMKIGKGLLLMAEAGGSAISGHKVPIKSKKDFIEIISSLTNEKTLEEMQKKYDTIIIDTIEDVIELFEMATAREFGCREVSEVQQAQKGNPNGYNVSRKDFKNQINLLCSVGYTVVFIGHEQFIEIKNDNGDVISSKIQPKGSRGEQSSSRFIKDLCDYKLYIKGNPFNIEKNQEVMSTAWCVETSEFFAGSRFGGMPSFINPFTAEGLKEAIINAQNKTAEEQNARLVTFEIDRSGYSVEEYQDLIKPYFQKLIKTHKENVDEIVASALGEKKKISQATKENISELEDIYCNLVAFACEKGIVVEI